MLIKISREIFRLEIWKSKFSNGTDLSTVGVAFSHFRVTDLFDHFFPSSFFFFSRHYNSRSGIDTPRCSSIGKSGKEQ